MASPTRTWALFVLSLSCALVCRGQSAGNDEYMRQLGYEVETRVDPGAAENEEITLVGLESNIKDAGDMSLSTEVPTGTVNEASEPTVVRKKVPCLGCPTEVDITIPENLKALHKLLEEPLSTMDSTSEYRFSRPHILSATKQVESSIKYVITFEVLRTWCSINDPPKNRDECLPQVENSRICVVEVIDKSGTQYAAYNNCTNDFEKEMSNKNWESHESAYHGGSPSNDGELISVDMKMPEVFQSNEKMDEEGMQDNSQEIEDTQEVEDARVQRSANFGSLRDVDKSEQDLISQFAALAVKTLDDVDPDNRKRIVLGVTEAKKQIVNGIMYHLVIEVGTSSCQGNEGTKSNTNCVENQLYPRKICRVQIHRSWADESPLNAKVVKSECADVWPEDFPYEAVPSERVRRSTQENWPSTDGWKKYELDDRSQGDCFDKVMISFRDVLDVKDVTKVATVRDAHTRVNKESQQPEMVVTIVLTDPETLKMFGDVKKPMVVSSRVVCTQRLKRSPGVPGGLSEADVNDPFVKEITNFGMSKVQESINSPFHHALVRIIELQKQVVAGTLYHYKVEIAPTSCYKADAQNKDCTPPTNSEQLMICSFKVWDQPWTGRREVQDLNCGSSRSKREVVERLRSQDVEDPYVKELASFALTEIDKGLQSPYQQKIIRVVEAKSQVVAGTLMHLKLELVTTNCLKQENVPSDNCVYNSDEASTMCSLKVWDRSWLKKRLLQDLQCGRTRSKRDVSTSNFLDVNVKDPYVIESANYALEEIDKQTNTPYRHKLLHISTAQVEVGSILLSFVCICQIMGFY
ncbi:hypothetical protein ONE63_006981 [Megalurothrips usitatus]|uniref:Cystatin domain-containing protein n=1 Tax=Megalurothrips usitatus TaxID=439358 RepID=A0AAV7XY45_9NEOP|nr:hypothetical protein ONE63_006981 [Megalurothrips usitatus]